MSDNRQQAPMSQRMKTVWTVVSFLGGVAGSVLLTVLTRGRFRGRV